MIPYLLSADLLNTLLAALFTFAGRPLYPAYAAVPQLTAGGALGDQAMAGGLMWVAGSGAYLIAAGAIVIEWLSVFPPLKKGGEAGFSDRSLAASVSWEIPPYPPFSKGGFGSKGEIRSFDLLRMPILGAAARSLAARRAAQAIMLLLAAAVVLDGLLGPRMSPMNLAGVLPWTYWRGLVVIALLAVGNLFCSVCPFMLPRELGKRWFKAQRAWPRWLRGKWLALGLLAAYLWAYEAFDLWDRPAATAAVIVAYFAAAFAVDAVFRGASFCKHVCPIGQFHFVHAGVAPFDLQARHRDVCRSCTTHDCLRGGPGGRGCELDLFVPEKRGSLDCTLCLDCVRACPHDNVGVIAVRPGRALPFAGRARAVERLDVAALALLCVAGAFANAAGMLEPVLAGEQALAARLGLTSPLLITTLMLLATLILAPTGLAALATWSSLATAGSFPHASREKGGLALSQRTIFVRFAIALVPLGFGMWSAHFLFHFLAGIGTLPPVVQRLALELGSPLLGQPAWAGMAAPRAEWLTGLELLLLDAGLLLTVAVGWRTSLELAGGTPLHGGAARALGLAAPWLLLALALWSLGVWIVFQPMQMRGMVH
jgi:ferredoxin